MIVDGSKYVNDHGMKVTEDTYYYKNKIYELIKNVIANFELGYDKAQIGLLFFGESNVKQIKAQVSHPLDTAPKLNLHHKSEIPYARCMYVQFKSSICWVCLKHPACQ